MLVTDKGDGLYEINLGNLPPKEKAKIQLSIHQLLAYSGNAAKYFLPTVIAPRYSSRRLGMRHNPEVNALAHYPFSASLNLSDGHRLTACSHSFNQSNDQVSFEGVLNQDISLVISSSKPVNGALYALHDNGYSTLAYYTPELPSETDAKSRGLQVLVDCSGSMSGVSIDHLKDGLEEALLDFNQERTINLIRYGSDCESEFELMYPFATLAKERVLDTVQNLQADMGGTEIFGALSKALQVAKASEIQSDILLITDGQVWSNEGKLEHLAKQINELGIRVFCVGVGYAISESFLNDLSSKTHGQLTLVNPHENMASALVEVFNQSQAQQHKLTVDLACSDSNKASFVSSNKLAYQNQSTLALFHSSSIPEQSLFAVDKCEHNSVEASLAPTEIQQALIQLVAARQVRAIDDTAAVTEIALKASIISPTHHL